MERTWNITEWIKKYGKKRGKNGL
jgi:hypothetical protein